LLIFLRWVSEQKRFPLIYKYIIKQREAFQEQIEKAMTIQLDESKLDEYVLNRLGLKVERLKTAQITPPKETAEPEPLSVKKPRIERPAPPEPELEEETKTVEKALEAAAAAAALKLRGDAPEPPTQAVSTEKPKEKPKEEPAKKAAPRLAEKPIETDKLSSKEKLRRLASEVLNEVKKSKTD
jgi:hypothetical protein